MGVERRADKVPAEYVQKAKAADVRYCGTSPGVVGPIQQYLDSLPPVLPLVFGSMGETSAGVALLAGALAEEGAQRREVRANFNARDRDLDQVKALLSWYMIRRWSRLAVLRSVLEKEAALRLVTGSKQRAEQEEARARAREGVRDEYWTQRG